MTALSTETARSLARLSNAGAWRRTWHVLSNPLVAWFVHALALWLWHIPALFDATLHSEFIHFVQHACFILTAIIFWWAVITSRSAVMSYGGALLYMFTTALHTQVLGVLMTFSKTVWYPTYRYTTEPWGLTALQDQQLGGLIMWIPAGLVYIIAALALVAGWMRESERRLQRAGGPVAQAALLVFGAMLITGSTACDSKSSADELSRQPLGADPEVGREKIAFYGCASCHSIPGIRGADGLVGPSLEHLASRAYIGGVLENTPENLIRWIQDPTAIDPQTAMPNVRVSRNDARAIAGYLHTLR
jgi:cytochrome c2